MCQAEKAVLNNGNVKAFTTKKGPDPKAGAILTQNYLIVSTS